jgi:hypothetical protein
MERILPAQNRQILKETDAKDEDDDRDDDGEADEGFRDGMS